MKNNFIDFQYKIPCYKMKGEIFSIHIDQQIK